jgi:hypothetical protein
MAKADDLFSRHAAGNVQRENDCEWSRFARPFFELEKRDRLLDSVGIQLEIFLSQVADRTALRVDGCHID